MKKGMDSEFRIMERGIHMHDRIGESSAKANPPRFFAVLILLSRRANAPDYGKAPQPGQDAWHADGRASP